MLLVAGYLYVLLQCALLSALFLYSHNHMLCDSFPDARYVYYYFSSSLLISSFVLWACVLTISFTVLLLLVYSMCCSAAVVLD